MSDLAMTTVDPVTGRVRFRFPRGRLAPLTGRRQLAQQFVVAVFKTPGIEPLAPDLGGGLARSLGRAFSRDTLRAISTVAILAADRQMHAAQAASATVRRKTESIASASLIDVNVVIDTTGLITTADIDSSLISADGVPQQLTLDATSSISL